MSNTYVKKYDVGQIKVDLPYANYIHELPLHSFGDVLHTINLSLVFNYENKNDNSFSIANGYQLNLQKRIVKDSSTNLPTEFQDANGNHIPLQNNYNGVFTFEDDSQRIIRTSNSDYVLEYPDFSKELYNNDGYITAVCDKHSDNPFLTYGYESGRLTSITYSDKVIALEYTSGKLSKINYAGTTINFSYPTNKIRINHYSGNIYELSLSALDMGYTVTGSSTNGSETITYSKELTVENDTTLTLRDNVGTTTVNKISYTFPGYASNYINAICEQVDITNNNGVKTRIQFFEKQPLYSYEIQGNDVEFNAESPYGRFVGNVNIHNTYGIPINNKAICIQTMNDGMHMNYDATFKKWQTDIRGNSEQSERFILSGWIKTNDISVLSSETLFLGLSDSDIVGRIDINFVKNKQWVYFATMLNISTNTLIVLPQNGNISMRDFRITFLETSNDTASHTNRSEFVLFNGEAEQSIDETSFCYTKDSVDTWVDGITLADILKYKLNKKRNGSCNEVYFNECKAVISNVDDFKALWGETCVSIDNFDVGIKTCSNNKTLLTRFNVNVNNSNNIEKIQRVGNTIISREFLNNNLDVVESIVEGVTTHYERDNNGLITKEYVAGLYRYDTTYADGYIAKKEVDPVTEATISTTKYYIDGTWGGVYKIEVLDANNVVKSTVTNTYDGDMSVLTGKAFGNRVNSMGYKNGNLETLATGNLKYKMSYSNGYLTGVSKLDATTNNATNEVFNSIESHTHDEDGGETTVTSKYPSSTSALHTEIKIFDKYNRLKEIDGVLVNTYDVSPEYNNGYVIKETDNASGKLATTQDLTRGETLKYAYEDNRLSRVATVDVTGTIKEETFEYDEANRVTRDRLCYEANNQKIFESVIAYEKAASESISDNRVNKFSCYLDGETSPTAQTGYDFDDFNRVKSKFCSIEGKEFVEHISYDKTRPTRLVDMVDGRPLRTTDYTYDVMGRIASVSAGGQTTSYTYDEYGQLVGETNLGLDKTFQYEYNGIGNISSVTTNGTVVKFGYTNSSHPDRLTSYNNKPITYNANGGIASYDGWNYTWSNGKLSGISKTSIGSIARAPVNPVTTSTKNYTFEYNAFGQRISSQYSHTLTSGALSPIQPGDVTSYNKNYTYDSTGRLIEEVINGERYVTGSFTNKLRYLYDANGMVGVEYSNGANIGSYYYLRNLLGDVVAIYDSNGARVVEYAYDAWGNCTVKGTTSNYNLAYDNPIRYRGYYYDADTNLYYLNARYYSPEWRRFISLDKTSYLDPESVNGLNLYCYCNNDPINFVDPSGNVALSSFLIGLGIAAAIGAGVGVASYAAGQVIEFSYTGIWEWAWSDFLISTFAGAVGGAAVYLLGPKAPIALSAFVGGFASNSTTMLMENAIYDSGHSPYDIIISSAIAGGWSIISSGIMNGIMINGLNAGTGSYSSISSQIYTKFRNGQISNIKLQTFGKMFAVEAYGSLLGPFTDVSYSQTGINDFILSLC